MIWSSSGCIIGSPPEMVTIDVPKSASLSKRLLMTARSMGFELWSYSLQYPHARLQRRIGMRWARTGCRLESSARLIKLASRSFSFRNLVLRILLAKNMRLGRSNATAHKNKPQITQISHPCNLWFESVERRLTLDDLHARVELDIKVALADLLILFETR